MGTHRVANGQSRSFAGPADPFFKLGFIILEAFEGPVLKLLIVVASLKNGAIKL